MAFFLDGFENYSSIQNPLVSNFNSVSASMINDEVLVEIMMNYSEGLNQLNYSDMMTYTQDYEVYVQNSLILDELTKGNAMPGFSIGKYSSKFWFDNL